MNRIEMMKRHLGEPVEVELGEGDSVLLAPLLINDVPDLLEVQFEMTSSIKRGASPDEWEIRIPKETAEKAIKLIKKSLLIAMPEMKDDAETLDKFIAANSWKLLTAMLTLNTFTSEREKRKAEKMAKIKERIKGEPSKGTPAKEEA